MSLNPPIPDLSPDARLLLNRMELNRGYELADLQALAPGASLDALREAMQELWIARQVERDGYTGWRRHRSAPAHEAPSQRERERVATHGRAPDRVRPEELFDHDAFASFFKE
jgi:hypothetical protein